VRQPAREPHDHPNHRRHGRTRIATHLRTGEGGLCRDARSRHSSQVQSTSHTGGNLKGPKGVRDRETRADEVSLRGPRPGRNGDAGEGPVHPSGLRRSERAGTAQSARAPVAVLCNGEILAARRPAEIAGGLALARAGRRCDPPEGRRGGHGFDASANGRGLRRRRARSGPPPRRRALAGGHRTRSQRPRLPREDGIAVAVADGARAVAPHRRSSPWYRASARVHGRRSRCRPARGEDGESATRRRVDGRSGTPR